MSVRRAILAIAVLVAAGAGVLIWRGCGGASTAPPADSAAQQPARAHNGAQWPGRSSIAGRRIAGIVVAEDGSPVRGASVRLAGEVAAATEPSETTDAAGRFDFGVRPAAAYVVVAELPRLTGALQRIDLRDSTMAPEQLRLVLYACIASIHGTIRDTAGGVIPGARVVRGRGMTGGAEADDKGSYELCVPPGGAAVVVTADGYADLGDQVNVFGRTRYDFALSPGASVIGRVVRAGDRAAVADAIVELRSSDPRDRGTLAVASDAEGRFHLDGVAPGRHEIRVRAERLATAGPVEVIAEVGKAPEEVVCELAPTLVIAGKVIERGSKAPIAGAAIALWLPAERRQVHQSISQADGSFVIEHVTAGSYLPIVGRTRGGGPLPNITVEATDVTGVVLEATRGATISGRILHGGKPVHGARVTAEAAVAESDHEGRYTLRDVPPGTYQIYAESHRAGAFTRGPPLAVAAGEQKTGVDLELDLSGSVAGIVVDQNDAPVGGAFVRFSLLRGQDFGLATTADDGTFTARGMAGGGDYIYEVRPRDDSPVVYAPATGKRHAPIAVADGQSHVTGVRIKIRVERFVIAGRVTDAAGKPVADVTVRAQARERGWYRMPTAISDDTGAFAIRDLPAGTYQLQATGSHGEAREDRVAAGRTDVALRLQELGGIDGTIEGVASDDVIAYADEGRQFRARRAGNAFHFRNLPPGAYTVVASSRTEHTSAKVIVPAGGTATVAIRKREVGIIEGTVVDEKSRAPIAGLRCTSRVLDYYETAAPRYADTGANGAFRLERSPVGVNHVTCYGEERSAVGTATVTAGQVARVDLAAKPRLAPTRSGHAGMTLEDQLGEVMVKTVEPNGPAARAGIAVGDVIMKLGDESIDRGMGRVLQHAIEDRPIGTRIQLTLERGDKQLTVQLTLEAPAE